MKKVLIITYYWSPSGGIGVLRCLKFAKYLRQFGWEPVIYTASNPQYPYIDHSNDKDIPEGIEILKHPIFEPFSLFKKFTGKKKDEPISNPLVTKEKNRGVVEKLAIWIRANFFIPDARAFWIKPSVKFLSNYLRENKVDAILSNGPPHTNTVIACRLAQKFSIPWLADFQDPWTQVDYYSLFPIGKRADRIHKKLEQEVFNTANKITIASPTWKKDLEKIGAKNVDVIYWGYDEDDFKNIDQKQTEKFTIFHAGIFGHDRLSPSFFEALKEVIEEIPSFSSDLEIQFFGMVDHTVIEEIKRNNLMGHTILGGTIGREVVLQKMIAAFLLLLPLNKSLNINGRLPGKLYEYLRSYNWILAIGPGSSDVRQLLDQTSSGKIADFGEKELLKKHIQHFYKLYLNKEYRSKNKESIHGYDVRKQTQNLTSHLNQIT